MESNNLECPQMPLPCEAPEFTAAQHIVPMRILMIDDEEIFTNQMIANLSLIPGYYAISENEPRKAIETAERFSPDLILLDLRMPGLDGEALDAQIAKHPALLETPVIYLTATIRHMRRKVSRRVGEYGNRVVLAKPVRMADLIECIDRHILGHN